MESDPYGVGGAVIPAFHTGVKKAATEILSNQIGFVIDQLKDIRRATEGTHGRTHTGPMVNPYGRLLPSNATSPSVI